MITKTILLTTFALITVVPFYVSATILEVDWKATNDNLITQDTATGLQWLDLTYTANLSYDDITSNMGAGQEFYGWTYATQTQVSAFLDAFGGFSSKYYDGWNVENNGLFDEVSQYWGDTYCEAAGCNVGEGYSYAKTFESLNTYGEIDHNELLLFDDITAINDSPTMDFVDLAYRWREDDRRDIETGSALIRVAPSTVPLPGAVWFMGTALLGLVGFSRKSKSQVAA